MCTMAPALGGFPTFQTREEYRITEGLEALILFLLIAVLAFIALIVWCCFEKCCCSVTAPKCLRPLSYVFDFIKVLRDRDDGKDKVLISGVEINDDDEECYGCKICCVGCYYFTMLTMLVLLFVALFCNYLIYKKTSTCNDIIKESDYTVCFNENDYYEIVYCTEEEANADLKVICYTTNVDPFNALGISFAAVRAVLVGLSLLTSIVVKLAKSNYCSCCVLSFFLIVGGCLSLAAGIAVYGLHYNNVIRVFLYGDQPLAHLTVVVTTLLSSIMFCGVPCCAFQNIHTFKTEIVSVSGMKHVSLVRDGDTQEEEMQHGGRYERFTGD